MISVRAKRLAERVKKTKAAAHKRIIKDGTIQFRLDAENMERLLALADTKRTGAGVLARMWVLDRLNDELANGTNSTEQLANFDSQLKALSRLLKIMISRQAKVG